MAKVLIIDDEAPIRGNLVRFLRLEGHEPLEAADGEAGLAMARSERPALILCDLTMPKLSGFEVLAALRGDPELAAIPFVFLSASVEPERLQAGLARGAVGYITKPFELAELRRLLEAQLGPAR
jgi:CheY-like chemotaxis protein